VAEFLGLADLHQLSHRAIVRRATRSPYRTGAFPRVRQYILGSGHSPGGGEIFQADEVNLIPGSTVGGDPITTASSPPRSTWCRRADQDCRWAFFQRPPVRVPLPSTHAKARCATPGQPAPRPGDQRERRHVLTDLRGSVTPSNRTTRRATCRTVVLLLLLAAVVRAVGASAFSPCQDHHANGHFVLG